MPDRVPGAILWQGGILAVRSPHVTEFRIWARMSGVTIVGVNHMARGAAGGTKVTRMIVGA